MEIAKLVGVMPVYHKTKTMHQTTVASPALVNLRPLRSNPPLWPLPAVATVVVIAVVTAVATARALAQLH